MKTDRLLHLLKDAGYDPKPYSGRGMFGKECVSITTDERVTAALADIVGCADDTDEAAAMLRTVSTDSMGRGSVFYWPSAKWAGEPVQCKP